MGVEAGVSFLYSHASDIFLPQVEFKLEISSDSTCHLWSLDPVKIHKSVLLKNITRGIHLLLRDLTLTYSSLMITYSFVESQLNTADLHSKLVDDPVAIANSDQWRSGNDCFFDARYPPVCDIYLSIFNGKPS